ncbi:MAG: S8 family serine peptidase [Deltaproteobacteria bacterium]|nr:S8 family serine peptidase [Deltaproteobacteria bacterium]
MSPLPTSLALALLFAAPPAHAVVIGIVDTGISALHPDFFDSGGHTRIAVLVDMTLAPRGLHAELERYGGAAFTRDEIDAVAAGRPLEDGASLPGDTEGHGTHVASVAAAEAADSSLFVVRTAGAERQADDVANGARLFFEWASGRAEPAVLNLSLGRARGPRDGSAWIERLLDDLAGPGIPGRVVVASAGNDGWLPTHLRIAAEDGCTAVVDLDVAPIVESGVVTLEVAGPPGATALGLVAPAGEALGPVPFGAQAIEAAGASTFLVLPPDDADGGGRPRALVAIEASRAQDVVGTWQLELEGRGVFDVWIADPTEGLDVDAGVATDSFYSLRTPSTAENVIVVAASSEDLAVPRRGLPGVVRRAPFSSMGPTLDGRPKPDIAAPGENVPGALAAESILSRPDLTGLWTEDGRHIRLSGTSQAAPRVAAAAARLLARAPDLDAARVRALLVASAVPPDTAAWTPEVGFGLLDVEAALARLELGQLGADRAREREGSRLARELVGLQAPASCEAGPSGTAPACSALPDARGQPVALLAWLALLAGRRWYRRSAWGRRDEAPSRPQRSAARPNGRGHSQWAAHGTDRGAFAASP